MLTGGAGGKGVWGKPGSEMEGAPDVMDEKDPNYDSDSLDNGDVTLEAIVPQLSPAEIHKHVEPIILEYYSHGDTKEVSLALEDYNFGANRYLIAVVAVELAMDHKPSNREMTSVLLSDLYERHLSEREIEKALDELLRNLPDLVLDTPDAPTVLGNFIARAIADDTVAPRFLQNYQGKVTCELAKWVTNILVFVLLNLIFILTFLKASFGQSWRSAIDEAWHDTSRQRVGCWRWIASRHFARPLNGSFAARVPDIGWHCWSVPLPQGIGGAALPPRAGLRGGRAGPWGRQRRDGEFHGEAAQVLLRQHHHNSGSN